MSKKPKKTLASVKKKNRAWMIITLSFLSLLFFVSIARIGVGDAEWAGMTVSNLTDTLRVEYNIPASEEGVLINWVEDQAVHSDLKEGDLVRAINTKKIRNIREFLAIARTLNIHDGVLLDILRDRKPLFITMSDQLGLHGKIKDFIGSEGRQRTKSVATQVGNNQLMTTVALTQAAPIGGGRLPTPKEQGAATKIIVEGHWCGMELIALTPELAKEYRIPPNTEGLLVDEISLEAAESGILAGDMLIAVDGKATPDLVAFTQATRRVRNRNKAQMLVSRRGKLLNLTISSKQSLGFSQNEAAQPIQPGAISPHRSRKKPCTSCHIIMRSGGQLPTDAGDILPNPPPIKKGAVEPHAYRGKCNACHVILK